MKKLLTLVLFLGVVLTLAGCDYLDPDLVDQIKDAAQDYCEENPDAEYCNMDFDEELEKTEMKLELYFEDYSNAEYTNQEIADMYFEGVLPEGFEEERNMDLEDEAVLTLDSLDFRLDGGFDITYTVTPKSTDPHVRKRPGRIRFDAEEQSTTITWYDGVDDDCDNVCDDLDDVTKTKEVMMDYFEDYSNSEMTNQEFADMYFGGLLSDEFAMQRDKDLADGVVLTLVDVMEREDGDFFEISYQRAHGDDLVLRKRPGRTKYSNITLLVIWDTDYTCDGVDDDCN